MNWYILYVLSRKTEHLLRNFNRKKGIEAFIPKYEYYLRINKSIDVKPMFNGYIFIKTEMNQMEFNCMLSKMDDEKDGLIKQLVKKETSALRKEEIEMFNHLLNSSYVACMSQAYIDNGKAVVYNGPLQYFEKNIVKVDKYNRVAYLDLLFLDRRIQVGLEITSKSEAGEKGIPPLD